LRGQIEKGLWNVGGERLWIAPERDFLFRDPARFGNWSCPPEYDPGQYRLIEKKPQKGYVFERTFDLVDRFRKVTHHAVKTTRAFSPLPNPYPERRGISYAGARIHDRIELPGDEIVRVNPWSITQIFLSPDRAATAVIPVNHNAAPIHYRSTVSGERLKCNENQVSFLLDGAAVSKIGIRPKDADLSRGACILCLAPGPDADRWALVLKISEDTPATQSKCYDVPQSNPKDPAGAIQSYNHGPVEGEERLRFGEIELQFSPPVRRGKRTCSEASHQLLAYEGPQSSLIRLAEEILGRETLLLFP